MYADPEKLKIGLLFSDTGATSLIEASQKKGALLAVKEINNMGGLLGKEIEVIATDPASTPKLFAEHAAYLISRGCTAIFGCYMSSARKAVLPIVENEKSLLFYPTLYEGFEYSKNCIYTGSSPNQSASVLADYLTKNFDTDYLFVGSDYIFPHEINRVMVDLLGNRNARVKREIYIPLNAKPSDIQSVIKKIKRSGEVAIFSTVIGTTAIEFARAYHEAGFDREKMPVASLTFGELDAQQAGFDASQGYIKVSPYFSEIRTNVNHRFTAAFKKTYGDDQAIAAETEASYSQIHLFAEAVKRCGNIKRSNILAALSTFTYDAPQGVIQIDEESHHTYVWPKIGICNSAGKFNIVKSSPCRVKPDPYLINHSFYARHHS